MTSIISHFFSLGVPVIMAIALVVAVFLWLRLCVHTIGPNEVGVVTKKWGKPLSGDSVVAFNGEAGYQAELLRPGLRFMFWPLYSVETHPQVQIPAGQIGVVISQIGKSLPAGAKTAIYKPEFGNFTDVKQFLSNGGEKGVQRPTLAPGTSVAMHPIAFLVVTKGQYFGTPITDSLRRQLSDREHLLGKDPADFEVTVIAPEVDRKTGSHRDIVGVVRTLEGKPLSSGNFSRMGGFEDIMNLESDGGDDAALIDLLLTNKNDQHNNFQDFQRFLDLGGEMGMQHDVLRYGAYNLNPFLVEVDLAEMLVVNEGEVAVVKAFAGLSTVDTSGEKFKFGQMVRPGHQGLWQVPLRTGKYAVNSYIYTSTLLPTKILSLNWASATSSAHDLDKRLSQIQAKSKEGFKFALDLQVQIHVSDVNAPRVISTVGSMQNLVEDVLQAAVGNHFRDTLQSISAVEFIQERKRIQEEATNSIRERLSCYQVETIGVYIQDIVMPDELISVLKAREIAVQQVETLKEEQKAEVQRLDTEKAKGEADQQASLAASSIGIQIEKNKALARVEAGRGEADYLKTTGEAAGAKILAEGKAKAESAKLMAEAVQAQGLAEAAGMKAQTDALGQGNVMLVNVVKELVKSPNGFMPHSMVLGGNAAEGANLSLMDLLSKFSVLKDLIPVMEDKTTERKTLRAGEPHPRPTVGL